MQRKLFGFVCLFALLMLVFPWSVAADDAKKELDKFQGTWTSVSYEIGGTKIEGDDLRAVVSSIVFKESAFEWKSGQSSSEKGLIKIDVSKDPKHIDFVYESDTGTKTTAWVGIYSIEGDTFKLCVRPGMGDRPKDFSTMNVIYGVFTFKRAK